jgi:uncharacterized integral membrane protein
MRYLKIVVILIFLLLALVFIFQNSVALSTAIELKYGFGKYVFQKSPPLYIVLFCALFLGAAMVAFGDIAIIFKNRLQMKKLKKNIKELESELAKFRNQPLTESSVAANPTPAAAPSDTPTSS